MLCNTLAYWDHRKLQRKLNVVNAVSGSYSELIIFFVTYEWVNKLECFSPVSLNSLMLCNTLAYWDHRKLLRKLNVANEVSGSYSQLITFFVTYEWVNKLECFSPVRLNSLMLCNTLAFWDHRKLQRKLNVANEVSGSYSQLITFFVTYELIQQAGVFLPVKP